MRSGNSFSLKMAFWEINNMWSQCTILPEHFQPFERRPNMLDSADRIGEPFDLDQFSDRYTPV